MLPGQQGQRSHPTSPVIHFTNFGKVTFIALPQSRRHRKRVGMEGVFYELETEAQFWEELNEILAPFGSTPADKESIQTAVRNFVRFTAACRIQFLTTDENVEGCCATLFRSQLFIRNSERVRYELISIANEETTDIAGLYIVYWVLLLDGQTEPGTMRKIRKTKCIPTMVKVLWQRGKGDDQLQTVALELMFEVCRSERLSEEDLACISEDFIEFLLMELEEDYDENFNMCICRLILALNEQFMVTMNTETSVKAFPNGSNSPPSPEAEPVTNAVIQVLIRKGNALKNFGQCIIFMLNRERETSLQLLILKLLYLIFTTPETYEYFYSNDLRVLVDVFIRELFDLPDDAESLRHTYLRVLHPLLSHTQLRHPPYYKSDQLNDLLLQLSGNKSLRHFQPIDQTTKRLVTRCIKVPWLCPKEPQQTSLTDSSASSLHLGVPNGNVSTSSVHHVAAVRKPPPWVKTPKRRGKKVVVVDESNGKGKNGHHT